MTELLSWLDQHLIFLILHGIAILLGYLTNSWLRGSFMKKLQQANPTIFLLLKRSFKGWIAYLLFISAAYYISLSIYDDLYSDRMELLIKVIITFLFTVALSRFVGAIFKEMYASNEGSLTLISNVARTIVFLIGIMFILRILHVSITPMLTALGVGGLAVALALQDTLSNVFAGINIIMGRKLRPGDFIRLENNSEGFIEDISWRTTSLRLLSNNSLVIPNSKLSNSIVLNMTNRNQEQSIGVSINVSYDNNLEDVERITREVASSIQHYNEGERHDPEISVSYTNFVDAGITLSVGFKVKDYRDQYKVRHDFIKALHKRYKEEGINIPVIAPVVLGK